MARPLILCLVLAAAALLAACGQVITITMPEIRTEARADRPVAAQRRPTIPEGYERLFSDAPHAFRYSVAGEPVRRGAVSERFELRDGDCGGSDCGAGRARAEIRQLPDVIDAPLNTDAWFGWSFFNASLGAVTKDASVGPVIGQWKLEGDTPAVFRLAQQYQGEGNWTSCDPMFCNRFGNPADDVVVELEDMRVAGNWGAAQNYGAVCRLFSMQAVRGRWVDLVVNTNFAADGNGYLRVWVDGELKCNYFGRLVATPAGWGKGPSQRRGIFATNTRRWAETQKGAPRPTMVVFYDEFLAGRARGEVDTKFRETSGLRPVD